MVFFLVSLGPHLLHMEVASLGVWSALLLPAYTTAIATQDPSYVCNLHHSSRQRQILNPLSGARDWTHVLMDTTQVRSPLSHDRNSRKKKAWCIFLFLVASNINNIVMSKYWLNTLHTCSEQVLWLCDVKNLPGPESPSNLPKVTQIKWADGALTWTQRRPDPKACGPDHGTTPQLSYLLRGSYSFFFIFGRYHS